MIQPCCSLTTACRQSKFTNPECSSAATVRTLNIPKSTFLMFADLDPNEGYETLKNVEINNHRISNRNVWEKPVKSLYHMHGPFGAHRPKGENPCLKLIFRQKPSFCAKVSNERVAEFFLPRAQRAEEQSRYFQCFWHEQAPVVVLILHERGYVRFLKPLKLQSTVTAFQKFTHVSFWNDGKYFLKAECGTRRAIKTVLWSVNFKCVLGKWFSSPFKMAPRSYSNCLFWYLVLPADPFWNSVTKALKLRQKALIQHFGEFAHNILLSICFYQLQCQKKGDLHKII